MTTRRKPGPGRGKGRNLYRDIGQLSIRVDRHEEQIGELLEMSQIDHKTIELHGRELQLLRQLSEVQTARITHVQAAVSRQARSARRRR